jgi:hypothetical protein
VRGEGGCGAAQASLRGARLLRQNTRRRGPSHLRASPLRNAAGRSSLGWQVFQDRATVFLFSLWRRWGLPLLLLPFLCHVSGACPFENLFLLLRGQRLENLAALHALVPLEHRVSLLRG